MSAMSCSLSEAALDCGPGERGLSCSGAPGPPGVAQAVVPIEPARSKAQTIFEDYYAAWAAVLKSQDPSFPAPDPALRKTLWRSRRWTTATAASKRR